MDAAKVMYGWSDRAGWVVIVVDGHGRRLEGSSDRGFPIELGDDPDDGPGILLSCLALWPRAYVRRVDVTR